MTAAVFQPPTPIAPRAVSELGFGFAYWVAFLLVLLPDNLLRASRLGAEISLLHEVVRIAGAASLGATVMPIVMALVRRRPLGPSTFWRHAPIHAVAAATLALLLVLASCLLAAWVFEGRALPAGPEVAAQLTSNWTLLTFAIGALIALAHLWPRAPTVATAPTAPLPSAQRGTRITQVSVPVRDGWVDVPLSAVDWIETQGNYVGLHVGRSTYLLRSTLLALVAKLDPQRFVRVHRRWVVALDRVVSIEALANGDALLHLRDGQSLRLSRSYRAAFLTRWRGSEHGAGTPAVPQSDALGGRSLR